MNDEERLERIRHRLGATGPASVSIIAQGIVERMQKSAEKMTVRVKFDCDACQDTGLIQGDKGWKPCSKCRNRGSASSKRTIF